MFRRVLVATASLTVAVSCAADELFDFSDLDIVDSPAGEKAREPAPAARDSVKGLPDSIQSILDKLDRFASHKRSELMKQTAAARKVAAEILVTNAAKTDAATRAALLEEAKRVETLPPERPLIETAAAPAPPAAAGPVAVGSWKKLDKEWTNTLAADGSIVRWNGDRGTWRWVDEKRGVLLFDYTLHHPAVELVQIDLKSKPLKALVLCEDNYIFPVAKVKSTEAPESVAEKKEKKGNVTEAVKKLAVHEAAARKETTTLIQSKNKKVAAWLLQQAPALPAAQARVVVERASELERNSVSMEGAPGASAAGGAPSKGLGGVWMWDRKNLEFADGGIVKVNGAKGGSWVWARPGSKHLIAFALENDDIAALAWPAKSRDGVLHLMPMKGKQIEVPRR